jgi:DNA-directed RNA polymerase subunit K/omega
MENELVQDLLEDEDYEEDYEDYEEYDDEDDSAEESDTDNSDDEEKASDGEENIIDDVDGLDTVSNSVYNNNVSNSIIRNKLTKYEYTRIFSSRVTHIQNGSVPMVKVDKDMTVEDIVKREFEQGRIPIILERTLPKEKSVVKEYRRVNEVFNTIMS